MPAPDYPSNLLGKIAAFCIGAVMLVLGFFFSLVLLAAVIVFGLAGWGYFWWKTRHARRAMREQTQHAGSDVIEGEAVVVEEERVLIGEVLPRHERKD